jgi:type II secretory pathway pseudopilin PulG
MSALVNQARNRVPRLAEAAVERARLTVVPRRARRAARVPFVTLVSLLLVLGVAGLLLFNTSMQQASFKATAMEERAQVLDAKEQSLQLQLAHLRDPQRVAVRAQRLGMVPPSSPAFIRLSDGKVLGNPTPATSADRIRVTPLPTRKPSNLRAPLVIAEAPADTTGLTAGGGTAGDVAAGETAAAKKHGSQRAEARRNGAASAREGRSAGTKSHQKKVTHQQRGSER